MSKVDEVVRSALPQSEAQVIKETEPLGYFALGLSQFTGRFGWVSWAVMLTQATMFVIGVWCAVQFYQATEVLSAVKWGISGASLIIMATVTKMSLMPQMQADRILRELKRVELLIVTRK